MTRTYKGFEILQLSCVIGGKLHITFEAAGQVFDSLLQACEHIDGLS